MITDEILRLFCSKDIIRPKLNNPFNFGDYTYATDGHILIRVPKIEEYSENPILDTIEKVFPIDIDKIDNSLWIDIPELTETIKVIDCVDCEGTGKNSICPDCEGEKEVSWESENGFLYEDTCRMCEGTGRIDDINNNDICDKCNGTGKKSEDLIIDIGSKTVNSRLLSIIKNLPNTKIAPDAVEGLKAIPFKFDNGIGLIMPIRKEKV